MMLKTHGTLDLFLVMLLIGISNGNGIRSLSSCNCLGQISSFECTVVGGSFTVWDGNAFMCTATEISLTHGTFLVAIGDCNSGDLIARGVEINNDSYTSRLDVRLSSELIGKSVSCSVDNQMTVVTVGTETILTNTTNMFLPPSQIYVDYHEPHELIFSWSDESHDDCSSFYYNISTTNCGTCTPSTTTSNTSTCTDFNSVLQSTTNNICNFSVQSVICGNIPGNFISLLLFLKVPDGATVKSIPYYGAADELIQLKITFNVLDLSQESSNDSFYSNLNTSIISYNIIYADSTSDRICHPDNIIIINASACERGMCQHTFDISSSLCPPVTDITVTVFATNIFGDGHNSTPITISGMNNFVDVTFDVQTMTVSCHFLNTFITGNKICIANISNNESCAKSLQSFRGEDIGNPVTTTPLQFSDGVSEICMIVTAIGGNKTVIKQKLLNIIIHNQPGLIENNVTPIIVPVISTLILLVIIGIVTVITAVIIYVQCCQTKLRIKAHEMYFKERSKDIQNLKSQGSNPYPHVFTLTHTLNKFVSEYQNLQPGQRAESESISLAGRIFATRIHGQNLLFFDMYGDDSKVQVKVDRKNYSGNTFEVHRNIKRGDIIGVNGFPERTNKGELSIVSTSTQILAPCLHPLPKLNSLEDKELRYRQRHLDLMINEEVRKKFTTRAKILKLLRKFLNKKGFVEVETPVMDYIFGGAAGKPFKTYHNELNQELYLRIAPELHLKRLVIGGLNRVYEIGRQFRNEGIDSSHSPEFTSCEFYMAYNDYNGLMEMTEELLSGLVEKVKGSTKFIYHKVKHSKKTEVEIDFKTPFQKIRIIPTLQEKLKVKFPPSSEFTTEEFKRFLDDICLDKGVECKEPRTVARLLDKLIEEFIQKDCINPTFIMDHPQILCPLAKWHRDDKGLSERFELIVCQEEICNAYTELNDPEIQKELFQLQAEARKAGDHEAHVVDDNYSKALEYGLPPTAGWGMGIDRLTMFLTDSSNIKEVLLFPLLKPKNQPKPQFQAVEAEAEAVEAEAVEAEAVKPHTEPVVKPPTVKPDTILAIEPEITPAVKPPDAEPAAVKPDTVPAVKPDMVPTDEFESVL